VPTCLRLLLPLVLGLPLASVGEPAIDGKTGLAIAPGFEVVSVQCTVCHSARLITRNRADREGWLAMIRWMQATQGLWPLGASEDPVLDYLASNYGARPAGRRRPLPPDLLPPEQEP
jgi:hypothetical protein